MERCGPNVVMQVTSWSKPANQAIGWNVVVIVVGSILALFSWAGADISDISNNVMRQTVAALWMLCGLIELLILNPAVGWAVRCVTRDGTTGDCVSGGVESNGWFELPAMQVMSQCFAEDPIPPPERIQLLRTLPQSGHEAGDTQISPVCQMLLAMRAADGQLYLTRMVGPPRQSGEQ